jgi:hypothetical protein
MHLTFQTLLDFFLSTFPHYLCKDDICTLLRRLFYGILHRNAKQKTAKAKEEETKAKNDA